MLRAEWEGQCVEGRVGGAMCLGLEWEGRCVEG